MLPVKAAHSWLRACTLLPANHGRMLHPAHKRCAAREKPQAGIRCPVTARLGASLNAAQPGARAEAQAAEHFEMEKGAGMPLLNYYLRRLLVRYTESSPTADTILALLEGLETPGSPLVFDHIAFRTYGGILSLARFLESFGYRDGGDELAFPKKILRARWMRPPRADLPRVFISELKVEELSEGAQAIIQRYAGAVGGLAGTHAGMCSATGLLPWAHPTAQEYEDLAKESEYAAWVLVNGYMLNHMTVSVHRLTGFRGGIRALNEELKRRGFSLNQQGGELKVSPDGGLLQSSTVADSVLFRFADGEEQPVPGAYIEFAERAPLPQFAHLPAGELQEGQRRDGFEVGNADGIFESTSVARKAASSTPLV